MKVRKAVRRATRRRARVVPMNPLLGRRLESYPAPEAVRFLRSQYFAHRLLLLARNEKVNYRRRVSARAAQWFLSDVLVQAIRLLKENGRTVRKLHGVGHFEQFITMVWLAVTIPCMPENYYKFEYYLPGPRSDAYAYLNRYETKIVLYKIANGWSGLGQESPVTDKVRFAERAEQAGLPVARTLRVFREGRDSGDGPLPKTDIFAKPVDGKGGRQAAAWVYESDSDVYRHYETGEVLTERDLRVRYAKASRKGPILMQDRVTVHHALEEVALGIAATCRIVTMLDERDQPEVVSSVFRFPAVHGKSVDNIHAGGLSAPIDLATGTLGLATDLGVRTGVGRVAAHPVNGARIEGLAIPDWDEAKAVCLRAHEVFRPRVVVGWDVCVTSHGPVIIEANAQPCVDLLQRPHGAPLGKERFAELLAYHVAREAGVPSSGSTAATAALSK